MCRGLTLIHSLPRRPAPYGASSDLITTPSCPRSIAAAKNCSASADVGRDQPRDDQLGRRDRGQPAVSLAARALEQVGAVEVQHVEQEQRQRHLSGLAVWPAWLAARAEVTWNG